MIVSIPLSNANNTNHLTNNTGQLEDKVIHMTSTNTNTASSTNANATSYCGLNYTEPTSQTNASGNFSNASLGASSQSESAINMPVMKQVNNTSTNGLMVILFISFSGRHLKF